MTEETIGRGPVQASEGRDAGSCLPAPSFDSLPPARSRQGRGGSALSGFGVRIEVVTPILGGGSRVRELDQIDVIRAATVRGHLRFWWRAVYAHQSENARELYGRECRLWGGVAGDVGGRSAIDVRVEVEKTGEEDGSDIRLGAPDPTPGAYALWPARGHRGRLPTAPRRKPGSRVRLFISAPTDVIAEVRNSLRAWILFGGYGSRTRRGLGSLRVVDDASTWLPSAATRDAITTLFGFDPFTPPGTAPRDVPWLAGAALHAGTTRRDPIEAWRAALDWLMDFRQGSLDPSGNPAREPGSGKPQPNRPSISNWPEADKVRHLLKKTKGHPPRHNATPAWPRAGFGLPIIGQFQKKARDGSRYDEPDRFELFWHDGHGGHDRLASPLIVKAVALADNQYAPCALWLNRAYPRGEVALRGVENSAAPFNRIVAKGDVARFKYLAGKQSLREAFLDWLHARHRTTVVAP